MRTIILTVYELKCLLENKVKSVYIKDDKNNEIEVRLVF